MRGSGSGLGSLAAACLLRRTGPTEVSEAGGGPTAASGGDARLRSSGEVETYPLPKDLGQLAEFSVMPYDHLNYALTWFSLSVATAIMATAVLRKGRAGPALARQALKG